MRKQLLILIITIFSSVSYAQVRFEEGYFIDNSNEKIECQIKNAGWKSNPTEFEYKLSENDDPQKASIESVKEFGMHNGLKYIRGTVNIDRSSDKPKLLSSDRNPTFKEEELFLKVLVEGKSDLYEYIDKEVTRYFYKKEDATIEQLIFKTYITEEKSIGKNNAFRQQLLNDLKCPNGDMNRMKSIEYRKNDLIKVFTEYSRCQNNDFVNLKQGEKKEFFNLSLRPRLNSSAFTLEYLKGSAGNVVFDNEITFGFGVEAEFILPFHNNKWSFIIEPSYQYFKSEKETHALSLLGDPFITKIDYSTIDIPIGLRHYFFLNNHSKIFINASYILSIDVKTDIQTNKIAPDGTIRETGLIGINRIEGIQSTSDFAFGLGAGYKYNDKFSLEVRYQTSRDILKAVDSWTSDYNTLSVILGYTLFK